jgi:hypothetical protein
MNDIDYQQLIIGVTMVIAASSFGQFGKSFATYLIEGIRKKKSRAASQKVNRVISPPIEPTPRAVVAETIDARGGAEKKARKALKKLRKRERMEFPECPLSPLYYLREHSIGHLKHLLSLKLKMLIIMERFLMTITINPS